jgi:hypothetical protein
MRDAARLLMEHQRRISPRVLTELCLIQEEAEAELYKRGSIAEGRGRDALAGSTEADGVGPALARHLPLSARAARRHPGLTGGVRTPPHCHRLRDWTEAALPDACCLPLRT